MITGLGFNEILVVAVVVLLFFGSKELPQLIRTISRFAGTARRYSDKVRRELNEISRPVTELNKEFVDDVAARKQKLRLQYRDACKKLSDKEREEKSKQIHEHIGEYAPYREARAVMVYISTRTEVQTLPLIRSMLEQDKRVVVPYVRPPGHDLGIAEITDPDKDCEPGWYGLREPKPEKRNNFFRSDLQLILCPGVAFDGNGGRLGRGKSCYDNFLREVKGQVTIVGLGFDVQIHDGSLPFDYHDIGMDEVITETGPVRKKINIPTPANTAGDKAIEE